MKKYIHNISGSIKQYQGREILDGEYFLIPPPMYSEYSEIQDLITDIQNEEVKMSRNGSDDIETIENALELLGSHSFRVSMAIDKDGIDQQVTGTDPTVIEAERILWDLNEDYDLTENDIVLPVDGVFVFDCQIKIKNITNVASLELALYKRGSPDDYWFILDKKDVSSLSDIQLSGATTFDFYKDERYTLKIKMTKVLPLIQCSCTIDGNDDYTAWGYNLNYFF